MPAARGFLRRTRRAEQVALHLGASEILHGRALLQGLDAFAVVIMLRSAAMLTTARMIEADEELRVTSLTKERSILILSNGKRCRYCSEE